MTAPFNALTAQNTLAASVQSLERVSTTIQFKANWLKQHRSNDAIQQMQTDAIIDLADAVRQIQQAMSALPIVIPDVSAVRAAAASTTAKLTTPVTVFKRP
jgi:hypothetical protein